MPDNPQKTSMLLTRSYDLHTIIPYVDWRHFLTAWGLPARLAPAARLHGCSTCRAAWLDSLPAEEHPSTREALRLLEDAQKQLREWEGICRTHVRLGLFHAWSDGDDIVVHAPQGETRLHLLRQQRPQKPGEPCLCLSDFIAPRRLSMQFPPVMPVPESDAGEFALRCASAIGIFAATVDREMEADNRQDTFRHMLRLTLAERLVEATAERMHEEVRRTIWGTSPHERLSAAELLAENYHGRRPAVGYPSLPDLSLNFDIDKLIGMHELGIRLTENGMMQPRASVSGLIMGHPATRHFSVGKIGKDQLEDYARRCGKKAEEVSRFLCKNLQ